MNNKILAIIFTITLAIFTAIMAVNTTPHDMEKKQKDTWTHTMNDYLKPSKIRSKT